MQSISTPFKFITILFVAAFSFIVQQAISNGSGAPTGLTGAPSEGNCTSCHTGQSVVSGSSNISVYTNMTNGEYIPDSIYQIKIVARKTSCVKFGFSTTMLNSNASPTKLGTLQVPSGSTKVQLTTGTRDYMTHTSSGTSALYTDSTEWNINWKAPATLSGTANLYIAMNATNNSGTNAGDQIHTNSFSFPQTTNVPVASITTNVNTVCQGDSILFQGSATNNPLTYQWTFPGGTPATSALSSVWVKFASAGNKVCSLRVANAIVNSAYTTKTVTILGNPSNGIVYNSAQALCTGDSILLANVFNSATYSYQWQKDGNNISGAISYQYYAKSSGSYRIIVSNSNGCNVITTPVTLNFNIRPDATLTTLNGTVGCIGDSIRLKIPGGNNLTYSWYKNNVLLTQTSDSGLYVKTAGSYYVKIGTTTGCDNTSNTLAIAFNAQPTGSITAVSDSICSGDSLKLTASTTDTIATYQWYRNSNSINGATSLNYYAKVSGAYTVDLISNRGCKATFGPKNIKVNIAPAANFIDSIKANCVYELKVRNTGNYTYQWSRDGILFNSTDTQVTASQSGTYTLKVSNSTGCTITSNALTLTIPNAPNINITPVGNAVICSDSQVTYQVGSTSGATYKWFKDGVAINGATQNSLAIKDSGTYYVMVDNGICAVASATRKVTVNPSPIAIIAVGDTTFCSGDSTQLSTNNIQGLVYQWYRNNNAVGGAITSVHFAKAPGVYTVKITEGPCFKISAPVTIVEKLLPAVPTITRNVDVLTSSTATTYQWYKNGLPISGSTSQSLNINGHGNYFVEVRGANGCKNMSAVLFVLPTGVNEFSYDYQVKAFPNPVSDYLKLQFPDYGMHQLQIMDASGRMIHSIFVDGSQSSIDMKEMEAGIYFVKIRSEKGSQIIRVIKN